MAKFIIYTPFYVDNVGGVIVLHKLASILCSMGHDAKIWPQPKPSLEELKRVRGWLKLVKWISLVFWNSALGRRVRSPYFLALAGFRDIEDSVVVYPEIVSGNPLGASRVVRWFLNKPGVLTGSVDFGGGGLFFYYSEHFNDWVINPNSRHHLSVSELMSDVYFDKGERQREGQCYMVRKGQGRQLGYHAEGALMVDGLAHAELSEVFNKCKYFVSYDLYTMYSRYAAMCGCIPVVVPVDGLSKEEWRPDVSSRYGVAYGWDDIPWAIETRGELMKCLVDSEQRGRESVKNFLAVVEKHFSARAGV